MAVREATGRVATATDRRMAGYLLSSRRPAQRAPEGTPGG